VMGYYFINSFKYIFNRFILRIPFLIAYSRKYDIKIKFKTEDGGGRKIYKLGIYEEDLSDYLLKHLNPKKGDIYIDIGANVGWYSVLLSKKFPEYLAIHAFEPDEVNFECLRYNLTLNNNINVYAHQLAVAEKEGKAQLNLYKNSNIGRHSLLPINDGPSLEVATISLDEFLIKERVEIGKVQFVKIDIEGFELMAFRGATKLLMSVPLILAEYSPGYMRKGGLSPESLLDLLLAYDYFPHYLIEGALVRADKKELLALNTNVNLFWVKQKD